MIFLTSCLPLQINGTENTWTNGIGAYTVALRGDSYEILKWGIYNLRSNSQQLAAHINSELYIVISFEYLSSMWLLCGFYLGTDA
ncbi:hypothetical protein DPMN_168241 [Dreissena polymorpha]|uniref:Uncharacterized protein n=1 Tax=Dreissena polymorpha TaxID=45954 RepID=A0A9D4F4R1_DREPO|nr:hypothetical protein DPMN_168241 [Dreissena polymorpha]